MILKDLVLYNVKRKRQTNNCNGKQKAINDKYRNKCLHMDIKRKYQLILPGNRKPKPRKVNWPGLCKVTRQDWTAIPDPEEINWDHLEGEWSLCWGILSNLVRLDKKVILLLLCLFTWKDPFIYCNNLKMYLPYKSHFKEVTFFALACNI